MPRDPLIGLVGKPSAGKSSTLNSLTDATSKVGNFPFTTIDPQRAVGYLQIACACARHNLSARCKPNHGSCVAGRRSVPINLLDVAGLVPGAHAGAGLGNKFLDDLRHADALIHVVDASGTVDAEGKPTRGYDPSADIAWLRAEIVAWVLTNLRSKWASVRRRHIAVRASSALDTLQAQFSGYGATRPLVARALARLDLLHTSTSTSSEPLEDWSDDTLERVVNAFVDEKFPTVIALNKIDHPDADKNIAKITRMQQQQHQQQQKLLLQKQQHQKQQHQTQTQNQQHDEPPAPNPIVLCSAISEIFLRKMARQRYIHYVEGSDSVTTHADLVLAGDPTDGTAAAGDLRPLDDKNARRIENLRDMVLFRYGSTGVVELLARAAALLGLVPVFPVRSVATFTTGAHDALGVFKDCVLVKRGSTVADVARLVMGDAPIAYVEGVGNLRVSEDDVVAVGKNDILSFKVGRT